MPPHVQILSTGSYVPERVVTNAELEPLLGEGSGKWLLENTGIAERRWMAPDQTTSDLVLEASRTALGRAGVDGSELDLVIVSTDTPDQPSPPTATRVQDQLGAHRAGAYDVNSACAGWVTALDQGARFLMTEPDAKYVLVAGGYAMSRFLDLTDRRTANLFADGAGAALLGRSDTPGYLSTRLLSVGAYHDALGIYGGGARRPSTPENVATYGAPKVEFVRKFPRTFNTDYWPRLIDEALTRAGLGRDDVGLYLFTQLNLRTIEAVMAQMEQPLSKTWWVMDKWGYTGSPCVIMALDDAIANGRGPAPGQAVVFCASGGGITMAVSVWRWTGGSP